MTSLHLSTGSVRTSTLSENLEKWSRNVVFPQPMFPSTTTVKGLVSFILNGLSPPSDFTRVLKRPMLRLSNRRLNPGRVYYQLRTLDKSDLEYQRSQQLSVIIPPAPPAQLELPPPVCNARVGRSLSESSQILPPKYINCRHNLRQFPVDRRYNTNIDISSNHSYINLFYIYFRIVAACQQILHTYMSFTNFIHIFIYVFCIITNRLCIICELVSSITYDQ